MANNCGLQIDDRLYNYASEVSLREQGKITQKLEDSKMQISPEQDQIYEIACKAHQCQQDIRSRDVYRV